MPGAQVVPNQKKPAPKPPMPEPSPLSAQGGMAQAPMQVAPPPQPGANEVADMANIPPAPGQAPPPMNQQPGAQTMPNVPNPAPAPAMGFQEPYGAQVLRRVHEDHSLLIQDYDEMIGMCENPAICQFMEPLLVGTDQIMTAVETLFAQHYGHLPPLTGGMPVSQQAIMANSAPPPGAAPPPPAEGDIPPEVVEEANLEGESPEQEMVEEEAVDEAQDEGDLPPNEGKKPPPKKKEEKALKRKDEKDVTSSASNAVPASSGKALCPACGKKPCACTGEKAICPRCGKSPCACASSDIKPSVSMETKSHEFSLCNALADHETRKAKEAHGFLDEIRKEGSVFGSMERKKSYHFHKMMGEIGGLSDPSIGMKGIEVGGFEEGEKAMGGDLLHPHRAKCMGACKFFGRMAEERAFGDRHRREASELFEDLAELFEDPKQEAEEEQETEQSMTPEGTEPIDDGMRVKEDGIEDAGEFKAIRQQIEEQQKAMAQLAEGLSFLAGAI